MFSTKGYLEKKTGPYGIGRFSYLQSLVTEYQDTDSADSKCQVLANLSNFAYDPINYEHLRNLNVTDLFLDAVEESDEKLKEFAIGGICNMCLDEINRRHILDNNGVELTISCLSSPNEETVISAITTLIYLMAPTSKTEITQLPVTECMLRYSVCGNTRLRNLAQIFLADYCDEEQILAAKQFQQQTLSQSQAAADQVLL